MAVVVNEISRPWTVGQKIGASLDVSVRCEIFITGIYMRIFADSTKIEFDRVCVIEGVCK
jgi:hypothetical protein